MGINCLDSICFGSYLTAQLLMGQARAGRYGGGAVPVRTRPWPPRPRDFHQRIMGLQADIVTGGKPLISITEVVDEQL
jgi:hypothetical protein